MLQQKISEGFLAKIILRFIILFCFGLVLGVIVYLYSNPIFEPTPSINQPTATPLVEEGVILNLDKKEYQKGDVVGISVKNNLAEAVFLSGCNQFDLERKENDQWKIESPLKTCVWEGNAVKIDSKGNADYTFDALKFGTFRINISYSKGCEEGKPISHANCKTSDVVYSAEFTVAEARQAVIGEDFLINLQSNPSTGYSWEADFDKNYLMLRSKGFVSDKVSPDIVGAGGTEVFTFSPIKAGETTITINYGRSWESKPAETKVFKYNIKKKTAETPIDFYTCANYSDCVSVKADCCGCTAGGKAISINKFHQDEWLNNLGCSDVICPAVMSNDPSCINKKPKCEIDKCVLK